MNEELKQFQNDCTKLSPANLKYVLAVASALIFSEKKDIENAEDHQTKEQAS